MSLNSVHKFIECFSEAVLIYNIDEKSFIHNKNYTQEVLNPESEALHSFESLQKAIEKAIIAQLEIVPSESFQIPLKLSPQTEALWQVHFEYFKSFGNAPFWLCKFQVLSQENSLSLEDVYLEMVENSANLVLLHDLQTKIIFASPASKEFIGIPREELVKTGDSRAISEAYATFLKNLDPTQESFTFGFEKSIPNQELKYFSAHLRLIKSTKFGYFWHSSIRDVTSKKIQRLDLEKSKQYYQYLYEKNPNPMLLLDNVSLDIIDVNKAAEVEYGYSYEEFTQLNAKQLRPPEDIAMFLYQKQDNSKKTYHQSKDFRHCRKDGSIFYVNVNGHHFEYQGRDCDLVMITDISYKVESEKEVQQVLFEERRLSEELKASEEKLLQSLEKSENLNQQLLLSQERFRALGEFAPIGIFQADTEGYCTWSNAVLQKICDANYEEMLGEGWAKRIHPEDRDRVQEEWLMAIKSKTSVNHQYRFISQDNKVTWVWVSSAPMGNPVFGHVGCVKDITEEMRFNEQILHDSAFKQIILEIFSSLINIGEDDLDEETQQVLKTIARFTDFDRIRISIFNEDQSLAITQYEYCGPEIKPSREESLRIPTTWMTWWIQELKKNRVIAIASPEEVPKELGIGVQMVKEEGVQSFYSFPMMFNQELTGFITYASIRSTKQLEPEASNLLQLFAKVFASLYQRIKVQKRVKASEELYRLLANNILDVITLHNEDTRFLYASPSVANLIGYQLEELKTMLVTDIVHPEDGWKLQQFVLKVLEGEEGVLTFRLRHKDQHYVWVESKAKVVQNTQFGDLQILALTRDISEQRVAAQRLEESQHFLETIFESSTDAIFVTDPNHRIANCNQRAVDLFEANTKEDLIGTEGLKLEVEALSLPKLEDIKDELSQTPIMMRTVRYRTLKGKEFWGNFSATKLNWKEETVTLVTVTDITELKLAEAELKKLYVAASSLNNDLIKKNEDLAKINAELDSFVYSASHDLRAPLTSALGLIELCHHVDSLEEIREYLNLQKRSLKKMDEFIHEIVDYSRNSRLGLSPEQVDIQELLATILEQMQYLKGSQDIEKIVDIKGFHTFRTDAHRLKIILSNLISNAIRYADLNKSQAYVKIRAFLQNGHLVLEVEDNGQGIPKQEQDKIFQMFYRANSGQSGSGLGLYILQEALKKLKGSIQLESELGKGSIFKVQLPPVPEALKE